MRLVYYTRAGRRASEAAVRRSRDQWVESRRTGRIGGLRCAVNHALADRVASMSLREFANYTGTYTYRPLKGG